MYVISEFGPLGKGHKNHFRVPFILMVAVIIFILFFIHKIAQFVGMCGTVEERVQLNSTNNRHVSFFIITTLKSVWKNHPSIPRVFVLIRELESMKRWILYCDSSDNGVSVPLGQPYHWLKPNILANIVQSIKLAPPIHPDSEQLEARERVSCHSINDSLMECRFVLILVVSADIPGDNLWFLLHMKEIPSMNRFLVLVYLWSARSLVELHSLIQAQLRVESHPAPDASTIGWCVNQPSVAPSAPQVRERL